MEDQDQDQEPEYLKLHGLKCVACGNDLQQPVQLSDCLHIVCLRCLSTLKDDGDPIVVRCRKCASGTPNDLHQNSGQDWESPKSLPKMCDVCNGAPSLWMCLDCDGNFCSACEDHHQRDHYNIVPYFLNQPFSMSRASSSNENSGVIAESAHPLYDSTETSSKLRELMKSLISDVEEEIGYCTIKTHLINNQPGNPEPLQYFCTEDWKPVCGACSERGNHKDCKTADIGDVIPTINKGIDKALENIRILLNLCQKENIERKRSEKKLRKHIADVKAKNVDLWEKILSDVKESMVKFFSETRSKENDILDRYEGEVRPFIEACTVLEGLQSPLENLKVDESEDAEIDVSKCVNSFNLMKETNASLKKIENLFLKKYGLKDRRFEEMRLVLPNGPDRFYVSPLMPKISLEHRYPRHIYTIDEKTTQYRMNSFIVTGENEGVFTEKRENQKYGRMVKFTVHEEEVADNKIVRELALCPVEIPQGRYHVTQLKSEEIVASRVTGGDQPEEQKFDLVYCSEIPRTDEQLKSIYSSKQPLGGIAATADNNIFVCVDMNGEGKKDEFKAACSYMMVISLQGKVLEESSHNLKSPKHVAVSNHGEIAISDSDGHCVVIMNSKLEIEDRVEYYLPTSLSNSQFYTQNGKYYFSPKGICYDNYGRILVTDPRNNSIVRLYRNSENKFIMEPLIVHRPDLKDFIWPYLIAIGPGERLWVVCRRKIFVFDYQGF